MHVRLGNLQRLDPPIWRVELEPIGRLIHDLAENDHHRIDAGWGQGGPLSMARLGFELGPEIEEVAAPKLSELVGAEMRDQVLVEDVADRAHITIAPGDLGLEEPGLGEGGERRRLERRLPRLRRRRVLPGQICDGPRNRGFRARRRIIEPRGEAAVGEVPAVFERIGPDFLLDDGEQPAKLGPILPGVREFGQLAAANPAIAEVQKQLPGIRACTDTSHGRPRRSPSGSSSGRCPRTSRAPLRSTPTRRGACGRRTGECNARPR